MDREQLKKALQLYVVTDERPCGDELLSMIRKAIEGGATAIQLRRKQELGRKFVQLGLAVRQLTREYGVLFFVNDRVDVALLVDADGVHVGQDDISCEDARRLLGNRLIGVSADTVAEALAAEKAGADYLGVGAVFPTYSKPDAGYTGLEGLREVVQAVNIPVVAIGGIHAGNAAEPIRMGAAGVALVSAIMSAKDPKNAAVEINEQIRKGMESSF